MPRFTPNYDPIAILDNLLAKNGRTLAFNARTAAAAKAWQKRAYKAVHECVLGFLSDQPRVPLQPKTIEEIDRGEYVRRKVVIQTLAGAHLPVYVLMPKQGPRLLPVVLALHGHGYGVKDIVGLWEEGTERLHPDGYHKDFACELAKRGFLVVAPEISCFGERQHDYSKIAPSPLPPNTCCPVAGYASMLGGSAAGLRAWDALRVLDFVETLKEADTNHIGAMGISGGGMHTYFSTILDRRIKACVVSGYFCDWKYSITALHHCPCNFIPGIYQLGELSDLAGLIAPRPCLVENADHDYIFPIQHVKNTVTKARQAWAALGAAELLETDYFAGRHEISGRRAYTFLAEHLGR